MQLKFVGSRPVVNKGGVSFDESKPDKYTLFIPSLDLLEALELEEKKQDTINLTTMTLHTYKKEKLSEAIKKQCYRLEEIEQNREHQANQRIDKFIANIKESKIYTKDDEEAFIANIAFMRDYYLHYVTNESVYNTLIQLLSKKIHTLECNKILFPVGMNHGLVLSHLIPILAENNPPYDATITVDNINGEYVGTLNLNKEKPLGVR